MLMYGMAHDRTANSTIALRWAPRGVAMKKVKTEPPIDFRSARERTILAYKTGAATRSEVCDAQPELMRNAVNCGVPSANRCPICGSNSMVEVLYVFGPRLPAGGRCIVTNKDMDRIRRWAGEFTAYDVEVCTECKWNHLVRINPVL